MPPFWMTLLGFAVLAVFAFGGHVIGNGERAYIASAARVFVLPWFLMAAFNFWVRWWGKAPLATEILWLFPIIFFPLAAAFALWRQYRD